MSLKPEQMNRLSCLLDEALDLDAVGRQRWLDRLSPENEDLAAALRHALLSDAKEGARFATLPKIDLTDRGSESSGLTPGCLIGPYELERPLGLGGMAEVWLARRADGSFKREVALKLPMVSRMRKDIEERFARERDILASLEHPNIARFYDAGVDTKGLPYLAMEYVPGQWITEWCDARALPIAGRLELLIEVLDAVSYAHERGIVHRDLKPSNIMVTESKQVRLLDFGVAKLLEQADSSQLTRLYGKALTPNYASPEQLRGDAIDARSDIYSLGILLFEQLTGAQPYQCKESAAPGMIEQAIMNAQVRRPSTQTVPGAGIARASTPERLIRELRGDLDVITLKALAKDPSERYQSASAMAEDLERYLQHRPINAQPAPISDRVKKFVRRNRPAVALAVTAAATILAMTGFLIEEHGRHTAGERGLELPGAFDPPPHSIAVLPLLNLNGAADQEYLSDGLTEEMLNSLAQINDLQVAAQTSSFSFKGQHPDIATVARRLNVGAVLEGSVRRSGQTVRVTAQLIDAVTGFHLWSGTYDRDMGDVLKLQTEIATAVARALKVRLLGDVAAKIELGGTQNAAAFDAYLRAWKTFQARREANDIPKAIAAYSEAIRLDSNFALAFAARSNAVTSYTADTATGAAIREGFAMAEADARQGITIAPDLAEAHLALAYVLENGELDFAQARTENEKAVMLAPGNAQVLRASGRFAASMGDFDSAITALRRAVVLDPLNRNSWTVLGRALYAARRYPDAVAALAEAIKINPDIKPAYGEMGLALYALGNLDSARASCETKREHWLSRQCLAIVYDKLGRHADAVAEIEKYRHSEGDGGAYQYATIYAQWSDRPKALEWLDTAMRLRDPGLANLKVDPLLDPLRDEARFQSIERALKFP